MAPGMVVNRRSAIGAATPKSPRRRWGGPAPVASRRRLAGLTSRWTSPAPWDGRQAEQQLLDEQGDLARRRADRAHASRSATDPPETSSIASTTRSSSAAQPCGATTCGWRTRTACSRTNRASSAELCWPEHLDRDVGTGAHVVCAPHRTHPAGPDLVEQYVAARHDEVGGSASQGGARGRCAPSDARPAGARGTVLHRRHAIPAAGADADNLLPLAPGAPDHGPRRDAPRTHSPSCHGKPVAALAQRRWRPLCVPMK